MGFRIGVNGETIPTPWEHDEAALVATGYSVVLPPRRDPPPEPADDPDADINIDPDTLPRW